MPLDKNSYNLKLYNLLKTRGYRPVPLDSKGERSEAPQEADVFKFTFSKDDEKVGTMYATVEEGDIVLYYDEQEVSGSSDANTSGTEFTDSFSGLVRHLKHWAMTRQLGFRTEPNDKLASDMAQREYMKKKENISEGYYPMGKSASYNDAIPTVKIILQHTRQIQEGEQRFRHVNKIFLENSLGERILAPTIRPGIAQVYARHLAEGGVPNDERWNHIKSLCEDYTKMAGFVRAVKNNQFNESAQQLVNEGVNHYQGLRETLGRMRGHRGYNTYFESWTPTLMEDESSDNTLNELFVQETLDPRIESVLPILSKLRKTVGEMKEVNELAEWAEELTEAPGSETLAHNEKTEKQRLDAFDLEESDDAVKAGQTARDKIKKPAFMRKAAGEKPATLGDVERSQQHRSSQAMVGQKGQEVEESGLQAYLGNKKYGKAGMDALRKAGRDGASKEKMASIRAKYDKLDEEGMEEGWNDRLDDPDRYEEYLERLRDLADYNRKRDIEDPPQKHKAPTDDSKKKADESVDDMFSLGGKLPPTDRIDKVGGQDKSFDEKMKANTIKHLLQKNPSLSQDELKGKSAAELISMLREGVAKGFDVNNLVNVSHALGKLKGREAFVRISDPQLPLGSDTQFRRGIINDREVVHGLQLSRPFKYWLKDESGKDFSAPERDVFVSKQGVAESADLDAQAMDIATKLTTGKNLEKLRGMVHDSTVYRALDRYFAKYNIPETIYNRVANIVFKKINQQGVAEGSLNEVTQGVEHSEWADNVKDHYHPTPVRIIKKRSEDGSHIGSHAMVADKKVGQYNMKTGVGTFTALKKQGVAEGISIVNQDSDLDQQVFTLNVDGNKISFTYWDYENNFQNPNIKDIYQQAREQLSKKLSPKQIKDVAHAVFKSFEQGVAEDLDANQKRVGQLGPTEKVKNNNIGKLVGANESLELNEMDKSQPSSDRGGESSGNPYAKGGKATPIKAKDAEKDAEKALNKSMDKAHKKDVKEGQEDLDAILRIIRK